MSNRQQREAGAEGPARIEAGNGADPHEEPPPKKKKAVFKGAIVISTLSNTVLTNTDFI